MIRKVGYGLVPSFLIGAVLLWCCTSPAAAAAPMTDYCVTPPYVGGSIEPNLLLLIDNSASMYDLQWTDTQNYYCANAPTVWCNSQSSPNQSCSGTAYCSASTQKKSCNNNADCSDITPGDTCVGSGSNKKCQISTEPVVCTTDATCSAITPGDTCNNRCTFTNACYDDTYSNSRSYDGYFEKNALYSYDFTVSVSNRKFTSGATMPGSCNYSASSGTTKYVCIDGTTSITSFVASGNFLNWLTASKFDIEKQILTGGKYDATNGMLIAESRGCSGRKFIKVVPGMSGLTFGIRGGEMSGTQRITNQATEYGQTYIEIYRGTYNSVACRAAMGDWMNVNSTSLGTLQGDTKCCLAGGTSTSGCNPSGAELVAANQVIHDCFWYFNGHGLSNLQPLKNTCVNDTWPSTPADTIIDPDAGNAICSSVLTHPDYGYGSMMGYLGICYSGGIWDNTCALNENKHYCEGLGGTAAVTDPDSSTITPGTTQNVPGFVMEHGLDALPYLGDLAVKVAAAAPPTGLIDSFRTQIRFGAMFFQNDGSASECGQTGGFCSLLPSTSCSSTSPCSTANGICIYPVPCAKNCSGNPSRMCYTAADCNVGGITGQTCDSRAATDGGKFSSDRSYVGAGFCSGNGASCRVDSDCGADICRADVGTHSAGLIGDLDAMPATSWTPYAEMFYNAMGYYARTNDYSASPPTSRDFNFPGYPASYVTDKNPSQARCQKNNILMITDGMSTADRNSNIGGTSGLAALYAAQVPGTYSGVYGYDTANKCPSYQGSRSLPVLSWVARNRDIKNLAVSAPTSTTAPVDSSSYVTTYVVYTGPAAGSKPGLCDPYRLMDNTAANGGTALYSASTPSLLYTSLKSAFEQVAAVAASGTAASVLASGEGSGANLVQAVFYPRRLFKYTVSGTDFADEVAWTGRLANLWYYVDPFYNNSTIREDEGNKILDLKADGNPGYGDYITQLYYDGSQGTTYARRWRDDSGTGTMDALLTPNLIFEDVKNLWEAGTLLWKRDVTTAAGKRKIYTTIISGPSSTLLTGNFSSNTVDPYPATGTPDADNRSVLRPYLQATSDAEAADLINWVQGIDKKVCSNNASTTCATSADCVSPGTCGYLYRPRTVKIPSIDSTPRVWKLGDVVNSTPKISSWMALNDYNKRYKDATYGVPLADANLGDSEIRSHFVTRQEYKDRGMVYTGGNDGMLHAFKVGQLQLKWSDPSPALPQTATQKARLVNMDTGAVCGSGDTEPCGKEMWAFIPKNALPYLRYMADPAYCHVYSVDLTPLVFDASIGGAANDEVRTADSWRTILIGGMRFGGGCRKPGTCAANSDCVNTPLLDPDDNTKGLGYSTYFALDVTDAVNPRLLWEFSHEELGFATTGPAIVRINGTISGSSNESTNGNWFVIFGSGPTGPITPERQFLGHSDQSLTLFILDLRTGTLMRKMDSEMNIPNAFAGSLNNGAVDVHEAGSGLQNYQDDVVYVPYIKKPSSGTTWTSGGVGRLVTKQTPTVSEWAWSTVVDDVGPVTSAVSKLEDTNNGNLWLYFGTGRYYYVQGSAIDDPNGQRHLVGLKDPCYTNLGLTPNCTTSVALSDLRDVTNVANVVSDSPTEKGWYIKLELAGLYAYSPATNYMAERVITDSLATGQGTVFFTSYKPYTDICNFGGKTFIWGMNYNNGGVAKNLKGKVLIQVSTGAIEQKDLSSAFTDAGGRKTGAMEGKPPEAQGMSIIGAPAPTKKVVHIKER